MIDLWMEEPQTVARIKVGMEARSGETSKVQGLGKTSSRLPSTLLATTVRDHGQRHPERQKIVGTRGMTVRHAGVPPGAPGSCLVASTTTRNSSST